MNEWMNEIVSLDRIFQKLTIKLTADWDFEDKYFTMQGMDIDKCNNKVSISINIRKNSVLNAITPQR